MATQLKYSSKQSISVKPTIVEISLYLKNEGKTSKEALDLLLDGRNKLKELVNTLKTYKADSYKQTNVSVDKLYKYVNKDEFTKEKVFDKYVASTNITLILSRDEENDDDIIEDFTNIFDFSLKYDYDLRYYHNITEEERSYYDKKLYSNCIDNGLKEIRTIIADTELKNKDLDLNEVLEDNNNSYRMMNMCAESSYMEEKELIISPELIKELFNNNIVISKTLVLRVSLI
jgi:hypothetical protein